MMPLRAVAAAACIAVVPLAAQIQLRLAEILPSHEHSGCVVDPATGELLVFGGTFTVEGSNETWQYRSGWHRLSPPVSPPPRHSHAMVWDEARSRCVVFGGEHDGQYLSDTWEWDGSTWAPGPASGPSTRRGSCAAFDPERGVTVLYGGWGPGSGSAGYYDDTWTYDGVSWQQVVSAGLPNNPTILPGASMVYAPSLGGLVMIGWGANNQSGVAMYRWDGARWQPVPQGSVVPSLRMDVALGYDPGLGTIEMYGGKSLTSASMSALDEHWQFDGLHWTLVASNCAPGPRVSAHLRYLAGGTAMLTQGGRGGTWLLVAGQWLELSADSPYPREQAMLAWDGVSQKMLLFGGYTGLLPNPNCDESWSWDGQEWRLLRPTNSPPPRSRGVLVHQEHNNRILLFGGVDYTPSPVGRGDTWQWDGTDWSQANVQNAPPPDPFVCGAYDGVRQRVVVYCGSTHQTWEWDGSQWLQRNPVLPSPVMQRGAMAFDRATGRCVMFGTSGASGRDTWEFDGVNWVRNANWATAPTQFHQGYTLTADPTRQAMTLLGCANAQGAALSVTTLHEFRDGAWLARPGQLQAADLQRSDPATAFDPVHREIVMFGGRKPNYWRHADTWRLSAVEVATVIPFGLGCPGSAGVPSLAAPRPAWIGNLLTMQLGQLPVAGTAVLVGGLGSSLVHSPGLPESLAPFGMPACQREVTTEAIAVMAIVNQQAACSLPVPADSTLLGLDLFWQGVSLDPSAQGGAALSNALQTHVGSR